jgi:hypothetical protein
MREVDRGHLADERAEGGSSMIRNRLFAALAVGLCFLTTASAGPPYYIGEWGWLQHCPTGDYSFLHYWTPGLFRVRANVHPANVDQYVPAPAVPIAGSFDKQPCMPRAPAPTLPYANPESYYGRKYAPFGVQIP